MTTQFVAKNLYNREAKSRSRDMLCFLTSPETDMQIQCKSAKNFKSHRINVFQYFSHPKQTSEDSCCLLMCDVYDQFFE